MKNVIKIDNYMNKLNPWPFYESDEIKAVTNVLKSSEVNYLNGVRRKII